MTTITAELPAIVGTPIPKNGGRAEVRTGFSVYKGAVLVDVRIFTQYGDLVGMGPTKQGVSLPVAHLPTLIEQLEQVRAIAVERALL